MSRNFPSIVTNPGGMLQKLSDVGNWIASLRLVEIGQNTGFTGTDDDWAGRFAAAIWKSNANGTTDFSPLPNIPKIPQGSPYCAMTATIILRLAAQYANDLTDDERHYYLNSGNASSGFPRSMDKKYVKKISSPQVGTLNCRGVPGSGHVNISVKNGQKTTINGNGSCKENVAGTQRDAKGGGICPGTATGLQEFYLLRIGGVFKEGSTFIADNRVIDSTPINDTNNNYNNQNNTSTIRDNGGVDLSAAYADINAFLLTGKSMSDSVVNKKEGNTVESKGQEESTRIILEPKHALDNIINPGATESVG